jgi:hypothetical protein
MARASGTQALSTAALQLPPVPCRAVNIRNNDASINMLVGWNSTTQSYSVPATQAVRIECGNLNQLWAKSASGTPTLSYLTE